MRYAVVIERGPRNYAASAPDLPGCIATGDTLEEVKTLMQSAVISHVANLRAHGEAVPVPTTDIAYAEVA